MAIRRGAVVEGKKDLYSESETSGQITSISQLAISPVILKSSERMIDIFTACTCSSNDFKLELLSTAVDSGVALTTGATSPSILISSSLDPFHDDWPHWKRLSTSSLANFPFPLQTWRWLLVPRPKFILNSETCLYEHRFAGICDMGRLWNHSWQQQRANTPIIWIRGAAKQFIHNIWRGPLRHIHKGCFAPYGFGVLEESSTTTSILRAVPGLLRRSNYTGSLPCSRLIVARAGVCAICSGLT